MITITVEMTEELRNQSVANVSEVHRMINIHQNPRRNKDEMILFMARKLNFSNACTITPEGMPTKDIISILPTEATGNHSFICNNCIIKGRKIRYPM